jgi:hypothetical protein
MPTTTKPAKRPHRAPAARKEPSSLDYIQQSLERASEEVRRELRRRAVRAEPGPSRSCCGRFACVQ